MTEKLEIAVKGVTGFTVTLGQGPEMIQCVCGSVHRAHGYPDELKAAREPWEIAHKFCGPRTREGHKTFWMSFCDPDRPEGTQFLGACLVDVSAAEADAAAIDVMLRFPFAQPDSEWIAAATTKAHELGCNPGGEIVTVEVTDHENLKFYELGRLYTRAEIEAIDSQIGV